ncbi:MAG: N-acetylmuramoyl-L-alanine amidase [Acidobacteria bacterium]|nr:N-acetylmuramoyl-L-alanine amidase [Acidobacteriota bacterium]
MKLTYLYRNAINGLYVKFMKVKDLIPMMKKIIIAILLLTFCTPLITRGDTEERYLIYDQHIYPINVTDVDGVAYVRLSRIKDIFAAKITYDKSKNSYIYTYKNRQAVLAPGKSLISVEGRLEFISNVTIQKDDELLVPVEFITKILPLIHYLPVEYNASSNSYILGENSDPYNLKVNLLERDEYQRLIVRSKSDVAFRVTRDDEVIKIRFLRKIILLPFKQKTFDRDIVKKLQFIQEKNATVLEIELRSEPDDVKSYKFSQPFRVVLDFMRIQKRPNDNRETTSTDETDTGSNWLESTALKTIVIDPGHGGENEGAKGPSGLLEKEITLQIANQLKKVIERNLPNIKVVLTRDRDMDLSLKARTEVANHNKADLFISLHCNGSVKKDARGAEVFILSSDASDEATEALANMENTGSNGYSSSSSRSSLTPILWELAQNEYLRESAKLAEGMQAELNQLLNTPERGVKQAPFKILTGAIMPAVLVEIAFITNPAEEAQLRNPEYQSSVANAIYRSILRFNMNRTRKMDSGYDDENE